MTKSNFSIVFVLYIAIYIFGIGLLFYVPFSWKLVGLFAMNYFIGMFFVTAGYHRYFSHRSYKLGRIPQFIMAWMAQASAQKGVLWWAANHRDHHTYSDTEKDLHSPVQKGFWYSHVGWIFTPEAQTYNPKRITDFSKYPELRFLNKYHWVPTVSIAALIFAIGGLPALAWGYLFTIICMYQASYSVNSLAHVFGTKRFDTTDDSRNNWFLAIFTMGEGWHNNHHHCQTSCRQGYKWWEYDMTFYILTFFSWLGIVKDMRPFRAEKQKGSAIVEAQPAS